VRNFAIRDGFKKIPLHVIKSITRGGIFLSCFDGNKTEKNVKNKGTILVIPILNRKFLAVSLFGIRMI
jgi:hypothetical protein